MEITHTLFFLALSSISLLSGGLAREGQTSEQRVISDELIMMSADNPDVSREKSVELVRLLREGQIDAFEESIKAMPSIENRTENAAYADVMAYAVALNEMELVIWLNEHCGDCNLKYSGYSVVDFMGRTYEGSAWKSMNADMFKYVYENGAVAAFLEAQPERSIVVHVADYWIPEGDSSYGDYAITNDDIKHEKNSRQQKLAMLDYLIEQGHSVNEIDAVSNTTAMFNAVKAQDKSLVDFLLANGAEMGAGRNPLATVTHRTEPQLLEKLLAFGYDPNEVTPPHYSSPASTTLLGRIVEGGEFTPQLLAVLERHNINYHLRDSRGKAPIDYAFLEFDKTDKPFTEYLLSKGSKQTDQYFYSALVHAVQRDKHQTVKSILSTHPKLANGLDSEEKTYPLERALWGNSKNSFKLLLDIGAKEFDTEYAFTKLFNGAISRKNYEIAQLILDAKPSLDVNTPRQVGEKTHLVSVALVQASANGNIEWVKKLIRLGATVDTGHYREHPIVNAAINNHFDVVKILLETGAPVNPVDEEGKTLFKVLEKYGNVEMLDFLKAFER